MVYYTNMKNISKEFLMGYIRGNISALLNKLKESIPIEYINADKLEIVLIDIIMGLIDGENFEITIDKISQTIEIDKNLEIDLNENFEIKNLYVIIPYNIRCECGNDNKFISEFCSSCFSKRNLLCPFCGDKLEHEQCVECDLFFEENEVAYEFINNKIVNI